MKHELEAIQSIAKQADHNARIAKMYFGIAHECDFLGDAMLAESTESALRRGTEIQQTLDDMITDWIAQTMEALSKAAGAKDLDKLPRRLRRLQTLQRRAIEIRSGIAQAKGRIYARRKKAKKLKSFK